MIAAGEQWERSRVRATLHWQRGDRRRREGGDRQGAGDVSEKVDSETGSGGGGQEVLGQRI